MLAEVRSTVALRGNSKVEISELPQDHFPSQQPSEIKDWPMQTMAFLSGAHKLAKIQAHAVSYDSLEPHLVRRVFFLLEH